MFKKSFVVTIFLGLLLFSQQVLGAFPALQPQQGGTGTSTVPYAGQLLIGTDSGRYGVTDLTAGTNITIATSTPGNITISAPNGGPGGSDTQIQYNNAGAFGGDANLIWDSTNQRLSIGIASGSTATLAITPKAATDVGILLKGATSQSGNYLTTQDSSNNNLTSINSNGILVFNNPNNMGGLSDTRNFTTKPTTAQFYKTFPTYNWTSTTTGNLISNTFYGDVGFQDQRTVSATSGTLSETINIFRVSINRNSSFSATQTTGGSTKLWSINAYLTNVVDAGIYKLQNNNTTYTQYPSSTIHNFNITYDDGGNGRTMTATIGTYRIAFTAAPIITSGTLNWTYKGIDGQATGSTVGTSLGIMYYSKISNFDTNWQLFLDGIQDSYMGGDASKTYWGTGTNTLGSATGAVGDASINYDGTNFIINPKEIGAGVLSILGDISLLDEDIILGTTTGTKIGTATTQKLGFWNTTPIVQPTTAIAASTFVANTSGIVNDTATFDGYTLGQVVKALRNAGLLQ